jgi:hypothetical protein
MIPQDNTAPHQRATNRHSRNVGTRRAALSSGNSFSNLIRGFVIKGI